MSNYVQALKQKVRDVIHECESLEEYLAYLQKEGEYTITLDEAMGRVKVIRKIASENV